ncbi:MAG TPA: AMP-binding protein [Fibrobacteria bacterium]|nr:AMP-binding protein [Fibrobacteria bacterium]
MIRSLTALRGCGLLTAHGLWRFAQALAWEGPNASALLGFRARLTPRRPGLCDGVESLTWRELHRRVQCLAGVLAQTHGIGSGDRVALVARRGIPFVEAFYALCRLGAHVTVLDPDAGALRRSRVLVRDRFRAVLRESEFRPEGRDSFGGMDVSLEAAREAAASRAPAFLGPRGGGRISVLTGGTTGEPRVAQRSSSPVAVARPFLGLLSRVDLHACRELAVCSPVHHGFGLSALLIGTFLGPRIHVWDRWCTEFASDRIRCCAVDTVAAVPQMLSRILDADGFSLRGVRRFLCGGARLDPALARRGLEAMDGALHNLYGSSEAGFSILALPEDLEECPDTLGRALPGVSVRILDPEGGQVPFPGVGEIAVESSWAMESTAGRTCRTGDLGRMDPQGRFFLVGRVDDMLVSGGENVYPSDVEDAVLAHPDVREAVAWPVEDPDFGERLAMAVVVVGRELTEDAIREWLRPRLARYQMPARILVLGSLPWTAAGKPDRKALEGRLKEP